MVGNAGLEKNSHAFAQGLACNFNKLLVYQLVIAGPKGCPHLCHHLIAGFLHQVGIAMSTAGVMVQLGNLSLYPIGSRVMAFNYRAQAAGQIAERKDFPFFFHIMPNKT